MITITWIECNPCWYNVIYRSKFKKTDEQHRYQKSNIDNRCNSIVFWRYRNYNDPKLTNFTCVMIKLHCQKWPSHSFHLMTKEEKHLEEQPLLQLSLCQNCPKLFLITSKPDDEGGKASPWTEKLVPQALVLQLSSSKRLLKLPQTCQTC